MPGFLLHAGATVMCAHAGQAQPVAVNPRVTVGGQPTVVQSNTYTVSACPFMLGNTPSPCVTAQWTVAATRVRSSGQFLLLQDSQAVCTPNGTPLTVAVTQVRVKGM
jgi:hypothetical protein